ncbi:hypothetical protein roselon_01928 [Roseibacterium elongatum DSM 19469]|uniref:Uncharacterized protein n=1 Tax=Roseicyclus elongatus DSM 19469 TaxID=1294273 RepID=W8SP27_9RHOB|nr:hypothetical protein [Roseibacterium elongatum]AHM04285.1 hypothetical protein roselon_01928 [Roseibacterium elongatum DSM 19469]
MDRVVDHCRGFLRCDSGAVAVDWVVMTAASVALGLAVISEVSAGVEDLATRISERLGDIPLRARFEDWDAFRAEQAAQAAGDGVGEGG